LEKLNIEGKRSGEGFVAHKAMLVNALSRAFAARVTLNDVTLGRRGFLGYLKALGGSNIVKVIPSNGSASGEQAIGKRLKVICGANTSYLEDGAWIGDKTPVDFCDVRVSPSNAITPNVGAIELSEALARVLPFTAKDDKRPVLQAVNFVAKDGKLTLVSADGYRLAVVSLQYDDGEGQALIDGGELRGIVNGLRRAKRARISFDAKGERLDSVNLIIDTELIRYQWSSLNGSYPDWQSLIPTEFKAFAHFDTVEAIKALNSLKAIADSKGYTVDVTAGNGKLVLANPDDKGQAELAADTSGEVGMVRLQGQYLADVLKACGGMVEFKLLNSYSPMLFTANGYQVVLMPVMSDKAKTEQDADKEQKASTAEPQPQSETETPVEVEETEPKPKAKRSRAKEPVTA
jgi:DNA polymerase-3 subunit beta